MNIRPCNLIRVINATDSFKEKASTLHNFKYEYCKVLYINCKTKVDIICPIHGNFKQAPNYHLLGRGCPKCGRLSASDTQSKTKRIPQSEIIIRFNNVHQGTYNYSLMIYTGMTNNVDIICPIHGIFRQLPMNHIQGRGCPTCELDNRPGGYSTQLFSMHPELRYKPGLLYVIKLTDIDNDETFLKIGITTRTISARLSEIKSYNIQFSILHTEELCLEQAFLVEQHIKKELSHFQYNPKKQFGGHTECFIPEVLTNIISLVEQKRL